MSNTPKYTNEVQFSISKTTLFAIVVCFIFGVGSCTALEAYKAGMFVHQPSATKSIR